MILGYYKKNPPKKRDKTMEILESTITVSLYYSPLRYPGGKRKLARFVASVCRIHDIDGHYVEPYAGGAAVGLELLFTDQVKEITINDLDRSVYAFWESVMINSKELCSRIRETRIDAKNWYAARAIQKNKNMPTYWIWVFPRSSSIGQVTPEFLTQGCWEGKIKLASTRLMPALTSRNLLNG